MLQGVFYKKLVENDTYWTRMYQQIPPTSGFQKPRAGTLSGTGNSRPK